MGGFSEWYQGNDNAFLHNGTFNPDGVKSYICLEEIAYGTQYDGGTYYIDPANPAGDRERCIVRAFFDAMYNRKTDFTVTNSLFEVNDSNDPDKGRRKKAMVYYRMHPNAPLLCQTAYEHEGMNFFQHCLSIRYGVGEGNLIMDRPEIYERFNRALRNSLERYDKDRSNTLTWTSYAPDAAWVTNADMGGDPAVGQKKMVSVIYERTGEQQRVCRATEGDKWPDLVKFKTSLGKNTFEPWVGKPWSFF